jgi:hypothetical protein
MPYFIPTEDSILLRLKVGPRWDKARLIPAVRLYKQISVIE